MKITLLTGKTFDLQNAFDFPLTVKSSLKIKRLNLRIDHKTRSAVLSMPKWCNKKTAFDFVSAHLSWIEEKLASLLALKNFEDGQKLCLFGKPLTICHRPDFGAPQRVGDTLFVGGQKAFLHRRIKDYIKREAKKEFLSRSQLLAQKLGCTLKGVSIKDTKSRWGSCSSRQHINYSWRIALAPTETIDYLMAHETAHLKNPNHSKVFWETVQSLCTDFTKGKTWLETNANQLYEYR